MTTHKLVAYQRKHFDDILLWHGPDLATVLEAASLGLDPYDALGTMIERSEFVLTWMADDRAVAVIGVVASDEVGQPWVFASRRMKDFPRVIAKEAPSVLRRLGAGFTSLSVTKLATLFGHVRWLKRLGFDADTTSYRLIGPLQQPFIDLSWKPQ